MLADDSYTGTGCKEGGVLGHFVHSVGRMRTRYCSPSAHDTEKTVVSFGTKRKIELLTMFIGPVLRLSLTLGRCILLTDKSHISSRTAAFKSTYWL